MDQEKADGSLFKDRDFANVNVCLFDGNKDDFHFDPSEVLGVVKVSAKEALKLFKKEEGKINATIIKNEEGNQVETLAKVDFQDFLVNKHETALGKYGRVLDKIISITSK